jgi:DNA polymerase-3 subunit gamma/tau
MEHFVVSALKYRPQQFADVVGQKAITDTLENAIATNHLAQALLFCGPRGVGKTSCARILAKRINEAEQARSSEGAPSEETDYSFNIFELDAASNNSVDDIRSLIDQVRIPPQIGSYKVYIIDEVHMLSQAAFNAFLKTLEEPPAHAIFILATTEKHKILPTILSRCQIFDFRRITVKDAATYLKSIAEQQGIDAEEEALHIIAQKADGAMRDALSIFDRVVSFSGKQLDRQAVAQSLSILDHEVYFKAVNAMKEGQIPTLLLLFEEVLNKGFDGHLFIAGLASHFRDLQVAKQASTLPLLEVTEETKQRYLEQSAQWAIPDLIEAIDLANQCDLQYKTSKNQRLLVELCLMKLASISAEAEKKNGSGLLPAALVREQKAELLKSIPIPAPVPAKASESPVASTPEEPVAKVKMAAEKPQLIPSAPPQPPNKKASALSLASIQRKKDWEAKKQQEANTPEDLPEEEYSTEAFMDHWNGYLKLLQEDGRKILASSLASDTPRLTPTHGIHLSLANDTMKKEIEREQGPLLAYLREKLQNYSLHLKLDVSTTAAEKYAFTPQEKYEKLRKKNPAIDLLRKEFDLDF